METPLLHTKLYIPTPRPDLVPRPDLWARLEAGLLRKLTLISAPAGFGKTTLLTSWLPTCQRSVAWLSLDETDNELTRFLTYLIAALQQLEPTLGTTTLAHLSASEPPPPETLLVSLVNEFAILAEQVVLVLDDYHVITAQAIHSAVTFLLTNQPANLHLMMTSRADPPLPLSRLRVRGQLNELRASDLRFTSTEIDRFFKQLAPLPLSPDMIQVLETRTEGWVAGLQLAALSLNGKGSHHIDDFIQAFSGSHRYVLDYLAEEVLQQQTQPVRDFLVQTSILERLCAPLCDAVIEITNSASSPTATPPSPIPNFQSPPSNLQSSVSIPPSPVSNLQSPASNLQSPIPTLHPPPSSQLILEHLDQANLFIIPLDDQRQWYRYHHLFADFLQQQLKKSIDTSVLNERYRQAARWSAQNEWLEEAINYALAAQDWQQAAAWVEQIATPLWQKGRTARLLELVEALPAEVRIASPQLCLWYAMSLVIAGRLEEYQQPLEMAEAAWLKTGNRTQLGFIYHTHMLAAYFQGHIPDTLHYADLALEHLPPDSHTYRAIDWHFRARSELDLGQVKKAKQTLIQAKQASRRAAVPRIIQIVNLGQVDVMVVEGKLQSALKEYQAALEKIEPGWRLLYALVQQRLGSLYLELNQLAESKRYLTEALAVTKHPNHRRYGLKLYLDMAHLYYVIGQPQATLAEIDRAASFVQGVDNLYEQAQIEAYRALVWLRQGNLPAVTHWAIERNLSQTMPLNYEHQLESLTFVRLLIAQGKAVEALHLLDRLITDTQQAGRTGHLVEMLALKALAHQVDHNLDRALSALAQALALGQTGGYIRTFIDEGQLMAQLLTAFSRHQTSISSTYLTQLLNAFGAESDTQSPTPATPQPLIEPLSERELEVLRLIVNGATNREVAQELVITINTVKKHTTNIFGKLGVANRLQAVTRARELGLIEG